MKAETESPRARDLWPGQTQIGAESGFLASWGETAKFGIDRFCAFGQGPAVIRKFCCISKTDSPLFWKGIFLFFD
jgi:hypothetical protein